MIRIICKNGASEYVIHDPRLPEYIVDEPKATQEINSAGSASFTMYNNHPRYNTPQNLSSIIEFIDGEDVLFRGRILSEEKGFLNEKTFLLEGALAFLNDSVIRPFSYPKDFEADSGYINSQNKVEYLLKWFLDQHNSQVDVEKRIMLGDVTVSDPNNYILRSSSNYTSTWESVKTTLFNSSLGGYLCVRYENNLTYVDYLSDFTKLATQKVVFGENLLDLINEVNAEKFYSAVLPLGAKISEINEDSDDDSRLNISTLPNVQLTDDIIKTNDYIYSKSARELCNGLKFAPISETTWDDVTEIENLQSKAVEFLQNSSKNMVQTLTVKAIDMHILDNAIFGWRPFCKVDTESKFHNLDKFFSLTKIAYDFNNPENSELTFGSVSQTLTNANDKSKIDTDEKIEYVSNSVVGLKKELKTTVTDIRTEIKQDAEEIVLSAMEDYVQESEYMAEASGTGTLHLENTYTGEGIYNIVLTGFSSSILYPNITYPKTAYPNKMFGCVIVCSDSPTENTNSVKHIVSTSRELTANDVVEITNGICKITYNSDKHIEYSTDVYLNTYEPTTYIWVQQMSNVSFECVYVPNSDISGIFSTRTEKDASIKITADGILSEVSKKVDGKEIISTINQSAEEVAINADKIKLEGYTTINDGFSVDEKGNMTCNNAKINGSFISNGSNFKVDILGNMSCNNANIRNGEIKAGENFSVDKDGNMICNNAEINGSFISNGNNFSVDTLGNMSCNNAEIRGSALINGDKFSVDKEGNMICGNATITGGEFNLISDTDNPKIKLTSADNARETTISSGTIRTSVNGTNSALLNLYQPIIALVRPNNTSYKAELSASLGLTVTDGTNTSSVLSNLVQSPTITQTSKKETKENIEKTNVNAVSLIANSDIVEYDLKKPKNKNIVKEQKEQTKKRKRIGLVIGDGYNCPDEVLTEDGEGVNLYSMISLAWQAIKELKAENEELKTLLKGGKKE